MAARLAVVWVRALQLCRPLALAKAELTAWLTSPDVPEPELVELGLLATGIEQLRGDVRAARAELDRITLTAERLGIPWLGRVRLWQAVLLHDEKDLPAAEATYRDALGMLAHDTFPGESFRAHMALGYALCEQRRFDEAREYMTEALERAHAIGVPARTVLALQALGILETSRGRPDAALGWLQSAVDLARSTHNEPGELSAACNLGRALTANGRAAEGVAVLEAAVAGFEKMGRKRHHLLTLVYLGQALFAEGRAEEAAGRFRAALGLAASVVAPEGEGAARVGLGRILAARGERAAAAAELRAGAALLRAAGDAPEAEAAERLAQG
jgi:tetratricopeptide (TPR) repeat protein